MRDFTADYGNRVAFRTIELTLKSRRVAHAYLFRGPPGSPKTELALEFAKGLLCDAAPKEALGSLGCGSCWSCREVTKGTHPDLFTVERDGSTIKIKRSHEILKEALSGPYRSKRKVFLIKDAENLTVEASNALLKILEEPPSYVTFLLTATSIAGIPETIVSRCLVIPFRKLTPDALRRILIRDHGVSQEDVSSVLDFSDGSVEKALNLIENLRAGKSAGEDLLLRLSQDSTCELALKCARLKPPDRLKIVLDLEMLFQKMLYQEVKKANSCGGSLFDLKNWYVVLESLMRTRERLNANTNAFLSFFVLFSELRKSEKGWRPCLQ